MRWLWNAHKALLGLFLQLILLITLCISSIAGAIALIYALLALALTVLLFVSIIGISCGPFFLLSIIELPFAVIFKGPLYSCMLGKKILGLWVRLGDKSLDVGEHLFDYLFDVLDNGLEGLECLFNWFNEFFDIDGFVGATLDNVDAVCRGNYSKN